MAQSKQQAPAPPPPLFGRGGPGHGMGMPVERARDRRGVVRRIWGYLRRRQLTLIGVAVMVVLSSGLDLVGPFLLGRAIDRGIILRNMHALGINALLMLVSTSSIALLNWLQSYVMASVAQQTVRDLRADLFAKLQTLPLRFFDERPHGDLMSRLTNDVENVNTVLSGGVTQIVSGLLGLTGVSITMLLLNWKLALFSLSVVTTLSLVTNRLVVKQTRAAFRSQQKELGELNGLVEETITGQRVVKACRREPSVIEQFGDANGRLRGAATRAQSFGGMVGPLMNAVNNTGLALVAGGGGLMAVRGLATVGTIASFINYTRMFGRPLNDIANLYNTIQGAIAGAERVFAIIDEKPETDAPGAIVPEEIRGEVVFEDVTFSYKEGTPVLKNVNLHAKPGQVVALVGPTGAGKTTIVNLLTRFYELDSGRITVDGRNLETIRKEELRRRLGIVLQDTFLFSGSIRHNISYGRPNATEEEIVAASKLANADQFIHRLPHGYDTLLAERGGNLSQGQRQLIAIARAILADPRILILDEATSSIDTRTEKHIQEAMQRLMAGRTSFVIAHRLSTIRGADQILVIDHGEIIERGTHAQLLAQKGFYYRLSTGGREAA